MPVCHSLATHYNVSRPVKITTDDVAAAFQGSNNQLLRELIWDAEPETIIDVQIELELEWKPLGTRLQSVLPASHELRICLMNIALEGWSDAIVGTDFWRLIAATTVHFEHHLISHFLAEQTCDIVKAEMQNSRTPASRPDPRQ